MLSGLHVRKDHQRYAIFVALDDNDTSNEGINREIDRDYLCVLFYDFLRMILVTKSFLFITIWIETPPGMRISFLASSNFSVKTALAGAISKPN